MELRQLDRDLFLVDELLRLPGGFRLPASSAIVRLPDGGLVVLSPLPGLVALKARIDELGPVRALVSPNLMHHLGLPAAAQAWPEAKIFGRPGVLKKRAELRFEVLGDEPPALWSAVLDQLPVAGMPRLDEVAFFHRPSRTLLLWDLCFHVRHLDSLVGRLFMRLNGAYGRFGPSRIARGMMKDRAALRGTVDRLLAWNPERILVGHGDVVETGGRDLLAAAFDFLPASSQARAAVG